MKRLIFCLSFIVFYSWTGIAQKSKVANRVWRDSLKTRFSMSLAQKSLSPLVQFYDRQHDTIKANDDFIKNYYGWRFQYFREVEYKNLKSKSTEQILQNANFKTFVADFDSLKQVCSHCHTCALIMKHKEYDRLKIQKYFPASEFDLIKSAGYKQEKKGIGLSIKYNHGIRPSLGIEAHLAAMHIRSYKIKSTKSESQSKVACRQRRDVLASVLSIGYNYYPKDGRIQAYTSLFNIVNPVHFRPLQFGIDYSQEKNVFFYKPELGIGYKGLYLSGGYNVVFDKDSRPLMDKWTSSVGYIYVFDMW